MKTQLAKLVAGEFFAEALSLYSQLHAASFLTKDFIFPCLFKACAKLKSSPTGQMLQTHLVKSGFQADIYAATALLDMYMKLNLWEDAIKVFEDIPEKDVASFNAVISGYSQKGHYKEALEFFKLADDHGFKPDSVTIASMLSGSHSVQYGLQLHCWAVKIGVEIDIYAATSLLTMYFNCGHVNLAAKLFGLIPCKSAVSYNAYMTGMLQHGSSRDVLEAFKEMNRSCPEVPNSVTLLTVISACASKRLLQLGLQIHGSVSKVRSGVGTAVGTALIDMYCKCGSGPAAYRLFRELGSNRNLITWNSMIAGMMLNKETNIAVQLFTQLGSEGLEPDSATWNSMISGSAQLGKRDEAVLFFKKMISAGVMPCVKCITSLLSVCSALSDLLLGKEIHAYVVKADMRVDLFVVTALIDMYMKSGIFSLAQRVFSQFDNKLDDPALWNAMISGYGRNGYSEVALEIFDQMLDQRVKPNSVTFTCLLSLCSHSGLVDRAWQIFKSMIHYYGQKPTSEQLSIMVDLYGRAGRLDEALEVLVKIPNPSASVFASLLRACRSNLKSELGSEIAKRLLMLKLDDPTPIVILSDIYGEQGRWNDAEKIRATINAKGLRKLPGSSLIAGT